MTTEFLQQLFQIYGPDSQERKPARPAQIQKHLEKISHQEPEVFKQKRKKRKRKNTEV